MKSISIKNGLQTLKQNWKADLLAGFSVSLIALPLCLGISIASGFPPMAGIVAAIIGGLIVSRINGTNLTITGPAAGLIVVNLGAITSLGGVWTETDPGGYAFALAAIITSGVLIMCFGFLKVGKFGDFFPTSAVHGMLAAIGIIIIVKQLFPAMGVKAYGHELYEVIFEIPNAIKNMHFSNALIAGFTILLLVIHSRLKYKWVKKIPAPLLVLILAIPLAKFYGLEGKSLVDLPEDLSKNFVVPDFSKMFTGVFWGAVMTIALVTAIESILSAIAVDQLDPKKQKSNYNQDLIALGSGASIAGFLGGLPMISEIVRSSANIGYGAKSQWSNFFHGLFLLLFVLVLKPIIEMIPISALAGMLVFTGFRLASPSEFKHMYRLGKSEFVVFVFTCIMVLAIDLLVGVGLGILLNIGILLIKGQKVSNLFKLKYSMDGNKVILFDAISFTNYLKMKRIITNHEFDSLYIDFNQVNFIDHNAMHHLLELQLEWKREGRELLFEGLMQLNPVNELPSAERIKGVKTEVVFSERDEVLSKLSEEYGFLYNSGSIFGQQFRNFKLLHHLKIERAKNIITTPSFILADVVATELTDLAGGELFFSAVSASNFGLPTFRLGEKSFFDTFQESIKQSEIKIQSSPQFNEIYLLTGDEVSEIQQLFDEDIVRFLATNTKFKIEVHDKDILIVGTLKQKNVEELKEMIIFVNQVFMLFRKKINDARV